MKIDLTAGSYDTKITEVIFASVADKDDCVYANEISHSPAGVHIEISAAGEYVTVSYDDVDNLIKALNILKRNNA